MWPLTHKWGYPIVPADAIFLLTACVWIIALAAGWVRIRWSSCYLVLGTYFLAMLLSTVLSEKPNVSWPKLLGSSYLIGLAVLTVNLVPSIVSFKNVICSWIAGLGVSSLISILTLLIFYLDPQNPLLGYTLYHYGTLPPGNYPRVQSTFLNANMFCNYLNVGVMMLLAAHRLSWINNLAFAVILLMSIVAVILTLSPGLGGVILCAAVWYWYYKDRSKLVLRSLVLALGIGSAAAFFVAMLVPAGPNPLSEFKWELGGSTIYGSERVSAWIAAVRTIWEYPVFGRGLGLSSGMVSSILPSGQLHHADEAHQLWLNIGAQTGLVGLASLTVLIIYVIRRSRRAAASPGSNIVGNALFLSFMGAFLYQGLGGSFEDARHLWVLIGVCCAIPRGESS
jgi:hypothetical protein